MSESPGIVLNWQSPELAGLRHQALRMQVLFDIEGDAQ
jgi:hypothetical protein